MKIHEYQAKQLLKDAGVAIPAGLVAESGKQAGQCYDQLGSDVAVVKAQVHAGGRGKGGGIKLVRSTDEAAEAAQRMLENPLVTPQTGPEGRTVHRVLVEEGCKIAREIYLGVVVDRAVGTPVVIASAEGGVEIEEVAAKSPEKIHRTAIDADAGVHSYQARKLAAALRLDGKPARRSTG